MDNKENFFNSQEFKDTLRRYETAAKNGQQEYFGSDELADIAEFYYNEGKQQKAIDVLDYAISVHPGAAMPLVFKGRMALIDEKDAQKAKVYADMIADQSDLDCLYLQAEIMIAENNIPQADNFLSDAMQKIDEDDIPDYVLDVATLFIDYNLPDIAEKWLGKSDENDLADYREIKARIAFANGDYKQSEKIFEQLLDEDPYSGHYWNSLASTQFMSNRISESIASSEYSIAINPDDDEALLNKANGLFSLGNYDEAIEFYKRYQKLCPDEGAAPLFIGNCLLNTGHAEEALPYYQEALKILRDGKQGLTEVLQCLAFTESQLGHMHKAIAYLEEARKDPEVTKSEIDIVQGHILLENGHIREAIQMFLSALHTTSFAHDTFFRIAISVFDCGYLKIAYRMFKAYTDMHHNPGDEGYAYLAACCLRTNNREEYLRYLKKACETNPSEVKKILGDEFPADISPQKYYDYEIQKPDNKNNS